MLDLVNDGMLSDKIWPDIIGNFKYPVIYCNFEVDLHELTDNKLD